MGESASLDRKTLYPSGCLYGSYVQRASSFAGKAQLAYMFLTYNLVSTIFYTGINVPYATMNGL